MAITAASHTPVYIDGLYYVLTDTPTTVQTNATGIVTIIEAVHQSINGTTLTVTCDGGVTFTDINPMDKSFQKMATLDTADAVTELLCIRPWQAASRRVAQRVRLWLRVPRQRT